MSETNATHQGKTVDSEETATKPDLGPATLERFCVRLGHDFYSEPLLVRALTHRSFRNESADESHDNERLEFLGDSVLGLAIAERLFRTLPDVDEGTLSRLQAQCVSQPALAGVARRIGLGSVLRLGRGERRQGGAKLDSVLADAMEAVLGAVFIDGGYLCAQKVVGKVFQAELDLAVAAGRSGNRQFARISGAKGNIRNWKTPVQEILQERGLSHPTYHVVKSEGPAHRRTFMVEARAVLTDRTLVGEGQGASKKTAAHKAAKALYTELLALWGGEE